MPPPPPKRGAENSIPITNIHPVPSRTKFAILDAISSDDSQGKASQDSNKGSEAGSTQQRGKYKAKPRKSSTSTAQPTPPLISADFDSSKRRRAIADASDQPVPPKRVVGH